MNIRRMDWQRNMTGFFLGGRKREDISESEGGGGKYKNIALFEEFIEIL